MTLLQIRNMLEDELDLADETFIDHTQFLNFVNQAIREAEAEIHKFGLEDEYFRDSASLGLTTGQGDYNPPATMYADKILRIQYDTNDRIYEIDRLHGTMQIEQFHYLRRFGTSTTFYKYMLTNSATLGRKISLAPASFETSSNATVWFIRSAKQLVNDTDVCDIPFIDFILQFVRDKCINKEKFQLDAPPSPALEKQRQIMTDTLKEQVPDGHNEVEHDMTFYQESV